jgi:hypothetical protein
MALTVFQFRRDRTAALRRQRPRIHKDFERLVSELRANPHLFFATPNVESFVTYLHGYDSALRGMPLQGFFHWLEFKWNPDGNPRHWIHGLPLVARHQAGASRSQARVLDAACAILQRFINYRRRYGVTKVAERYMKRRRRQLARHGRQRETVADAPSNTSLERTRAR